MIPPDKQHIADRLSREAGPARSTGKRKNLQPLVVEFIKSIPEATSIEVADYLDTSDSYVRATAIRTGLSTAYIPRIVRGSMLMLRFFPLDLKKRAHRKAIQQGMTLQEYITNIVRRDLEC